MLNVKGATLRPSASTDLFTDLREKEENLQQSSFQEPTIPDIPPVEAGAIADAPSDQIS